MHRPSSPAPAARCHSVVKSTSHENEKWRGTQNGVFWERNEVLSAIWKLEWFLVNFRIARDPLRMANSRQLS
jgi:hypothetical protein